MQDQAVGDLFGSERAGSIYAVAKGAVRSAARMRAGWRPDSSRSCCRQSLLQRPCPKPPHHGRYFDFPPVRSFPKPAQKPHPPIIIGGHAENVLRRVVAHADGRLPNRITPTEIEKSSGQPDAMAKEVGRDPRSISISVYGQVPDRTVVQSFLNAGVDRVVVRPEHVETEAEMGQQLERMAEAVLR